MIKKLSALLLVCGAFAMPAVAKPIPNQAAPVFKGITSNGATINLSDLKGKPVILEWTNHQCPFVEKHYGTGNMQKLQRALTEQGATWVSIISSAPGLQGHVSADKANELTTSRSAYADVVVLDESGEIGRMYDAKTTPQMFLIDEEGVVRYMGAIDDKPSTLPATVEVAHNYLQAAWTNFKSGDEITPNSTKPYGCTVKYAK